MTIHTVQPWLQGTFFLLCHCGNPATTQPGGRQQRLLLYREFMVGRQKELFSTYSAHRSRSSVKIQTETSASH